jgi:hypothetical protein
VRRLTRRVQSLTGARSRPSPKSCTESSRPLAGRGSVSSASVLPRQRRNGAAARPRPSSASLKGRSSSPSRHSFAKIALEQAAEMTWEQRQLGHSSITVTIDRYGNWERRAEKVQRLGSRAPFRCLYVILYAHSAGSAPKAHGPGRSRTSARGFEVRRSSAELRGLANQCARRVGAILCSRAVAVAQLVEPRVVVPVVAGSSPVRHPSALGRARPRRRQEGGAG